MPDFRFDLPQENNLTRIQRFALDNSNSILVKGGPGSGKTVVTIFKFIEELQKENFNLRFFTYNRTLITSIKGLIRQRGDSLIDNFEGIENRLNSLFETMHQWYGYTFNAILDNHNEDEIGSNFDLINPFSQIFLDESQDLKPAIIRNLHKIANKITCGADRAQNIRGNFIGFADEEIKMILTETFDNFYETPFTLDQNFRNTRRVFEFARAFVPNNPAVQDLDLDNFQEEGVKPRIYDNLSKNEQLEKIWDIIQNYENRMIGILVHKKVEVESIRDFLRNEKNFVDENSADEFSYYFNGMPFNDQNNMANKLLTPFILTIESCKGLQFDELILPFFGIVDWALTTSRKNPPNWEVQYNADDTIRMFATRNHYYVAGTRAKENITILCGGVPNLINEMNRNLYLLNDESELDDLF